MRHSPIRDSIKRKFIYALYVIINLRIQLMRLFRTLAHNKEILIKPACRNSQLTEPNDTDHVLNNKDQQIPKYIGTP